MSGKSVFIEERITELMSHGMTILQVGPDNCDKCGGKKNYERKHGNKKEVDHRCKSEKDYTYQLDEINQIPEIRQWIDNFTVGPLKEIKSR